MMAHDTLPDNANLEQISEAFDTLKAQIPRLGNQHFAQQNQHNISQLIQIVESQDQIRETQEQRSALLQQH